MLAAGGEPDRYERMSIRRRLRKLKQFRLTPTATFTIGVGVSLVKRWRWVETASLLSRGNAIVSGHASPSPLQPNVGRLFSAEGRTH